ncbi:Site-specific recombinase XerD [Methylobacterium sp. UNC378MF]|uniref:tyrosine-type recombinase/integrase n=1 Tax=Methylobacterium sp. UNC378MF TaxID=1502748 RepID=UPI00088345C0|nr:site-specific integrase [Methylobacterium sp. UNC378MF]SDA28312.1 Site-specific recombinase XerD [Methylobacterium sp. UNC378MF]
MAPVKLTEAFLASLTSVDPKKPAAGPKPSRFVADSVRRGLMVNVTKNGTKTFHVRWTGPDGKSQRIAIPGGNWPDMRVAVARQRADEILHNIRSKGHDPKAEKRAKRDGAADGVLTVGTLLDAWEKLKGGELRSAYVKAVRDVLSHDFGDYLATPAADLTRKQIITRSERLQAEGKRGTARNLLAYGSALYGWAVDTGRLEANPFLGVPRPAVAKPDRVLSDAEIGAVYAAAALRPYPSGAFAQLLMLTGMRRDEVADMEWSELDTDLTAWTVPAIRMKNGKRHVVHLSAPARAILMAIRDGAERQAGCRYVLSTTGSTPMSGFSNIKQAVDEVSGVTKWRWHDLRHTTATRMVGLGVAPHVADKVLAHTMPGIMGRYQHAEYEVERRAALDLWAAHVEACAEKAAPAVRARADELANRRIDTWSKGMKERRAAQRVTSNSGAVGAEVTRA